MKLLGEYFAESGETIHRIYTGTLQRQREWSPSSPQHWAPRRLRSQWMAHSMIRQRTDPAPVRSVTDACSTRRGGLAGSGTPIDRRKFQFFLERAARRGSKRA